MHRITRSTILVALLLALVAGGVAVVSGSSDVVAIDADHGLDSDQAKAEYDETGHVSRNLTRLDMQLTAAEKHDDAGIDGYHTDINHRFVCIDYNEDIQRTVRVFIPDEYVSPRINTGLDPIDGGPVAAVEPTEKRNHTAMTMTFTGETRACYKFSREAGIYFSAKSDAYHIFNNSTSFKIPSLAGGSQQWQYVDRAALSVNQTASINSTGESLTLQYDADPSTDSEQWLTVPSCEDPSEQAVCQYTEDGDTDTVYLLSTSDDPPPVRYKVGHDPIANVKAWASDLKEVPGRFKDTADGLLGGGSSGN